jgi:hypothetical protein
METKELKIQIPEGQEIDWQESAKQEKIVFKKKENTKPKTWEEYCKNNEDKQVWFVKENSNIGGCHLMCRPINEDKNTLPTKELAEAFLAMMQLMSLREDWIGDWKPDWKTDIRKWCIICYNCELYVDFFICTVAPLSFPTKEMAEDFMNCFKDLLDIAKPLI